MVVERSLDCLFTVDDLAKKGVQLHILDIQLDTSEPVGKLVLTMMAAIAEFESRRSSERQNAAFAVMRRNGQRCGTVPYGWDAVPTYRTSRTGRIADDLIPNEYEKRTLNRLLHGNLATKSNNAAARAHPRKTGRPLARSDRGERQGLTPDKSLRA